MYVYKCTNTCCTDVCIYVNMNASVVRVGGRGGEWGGGGPEGLLSSGSSMTFSGLTGGVMSEEGGGVHHLPEMMTDSGSPFGFLWNIQVSRRQPPQSHFPPRLTHRRWWPTVAHLLDYLFHFQYIRTTFFCVSLAGVCVCVFVWVCACVFVCVAVCIWTSEWGVG